MGDNFTLITGLTEYFRKGELEMIELKTAFLGIKKKFLGFSFYCEPNNVFFQI